ncbi:MAG: RNA polymerase sigma factor [Verrucomicrobia bacterium]|nr:RNA polymerase sigma factor [Verrucomicrobiota bacterium]NBU10211.1 RNA polymerase sigma factor [Pseudomonadota bacterium]NDA66378.1 RNA polymerase sigma factor [Verrucomicrobiota bacterium]NDB75177.1 RNA polymerase sigma factor [Verrucomicrobiota bacterium]NDD38233.1 RNA polymerase sigma factor [Verrucomicrobiota bacterium]
MEETDFDQLVSDYYQPLYRFALSLTGRVAEACDLTQQTFFLWASKGQQLRDRSKVKAWLFTTLHREFLGSRRHATRFPQHEIESVEHELPPVTPMTISELDTNTVMQALLEVDETFRAPLMLFYLEDHSYLEIATILDVPIGTVMSRLARGKAQLRNLIADQMNVEDRKIVPLNLRQAL